MTTDTDALLSTRDRVAAVARPRARVGKIAIDVLTLEEAVHAMARLAEAGHGGTVFTPNVDHVVRAEREPAFCRAYQEASLSIVDGMPLVWAARLLGLGLLQRVSGSDWLEPLMRACADEGRSVYFIGGREGAAALAKSNLQSRYPALKIAGIGPRTRDIESERALLDDVVRDLVRLRPDFAVVALGSPLQEIWSTDVRQTVAPTVLLGLGSALDLAAGMVPRAPRWMSNAGFEWLYRLGREPRRLWKRYLLRGPRILWIVLRQWRGKV